MLTPRITEEVLSSPEKAVELPGVIADHTLLRCIGEGSYGKVYLAQNQLTGVFRAIKIVFRNAFRDARPYLREFEAICAFEPVSRSHEGFVQILHVGKLENAFYYIMELADDAAGGSAVNPDSYVPRTLGAQRGQTLPIEQCVEIGARLADCLAVLHEQKLIHRDIKPSNIIFVNGKPKLADIGLVTQIDEAKSFVGTAGFMPPEGPTAPASDIYSLGKVLYEIATGKDRCEFPQLPSDLTADNALHLELNQIVLRACHPDAGQRYSSAHDLRRELDLLQAGKSIKRLRHLERRLRFVKIAFAASVAIGLTAFLIYYQIKSRREEAERERQRLAGYLLAEGTSEMRKGYLGHALPYFIRAAEYDPSDTRSHQLRIGSVLARAPKLSSRWKGPRAGNFSADGKWLVTPRGNEAMIFESLTGHALRTNRFEDAVQFAKFSPDGSKIATALNSRLVVLTTEGEKIAETGFETKINDVAFSPQDGRIAVMLTNSEAFFFDPRTRTTVSLPQGASGTSISFDPTGERLMTCDVFRHFSDLREGPSGERLIRRLQTDMPYRAVFRPDGQVAAICGWTSAVPVIALSGELAGDTMDNDDGVLHAAFSPSNKVVATANYDGTVRLWDAHSFDPLLLNHSIEHESRPERVAFSDELTLIVHCDDGENYVWNLGINPPKPLPIPSVPRPDPLDIRAGDLELSAEGNSIRGRIGNSNIQVQAPDLVNALAVSPLKDAFAAGSKDPRFEITCAWLYRLNDLDHPIRLNHKDGINYIAFSHSGGKLVTCSEDFSAIVWDARTGRRLTQPMRHRWQTIWASFSSDDRWIVTAGWDFSCIIWNAKNGEPLTPPIEIPEAIKWVEFDRDDASFVVGAKSQDYRVMLPFADLPLKDQATYMRNWIEPSIAVR
jgi:WD40 repeat protein